MIGNEQLWRVKRGRTVPPFVRRDETEIFALRLCAFTYTPTYATFELVRRPDTFIPLLQLNRHYTHKPSNHQNRETRTQETRTANTITNAVPTPRRPNATLHGPERLAVRVSALEVRVGELFPDGGQVGFLSAEEVDALSACDFGVEVVCCEGKAVE